MSGAGTVSGRGLIGGPFTWATRPSAAGLPGRVIRITDVGDESLFISNGSVWLPLTEFARPAMLTVACGNSITAQCKYGAMGGTAWSVGSSIHRANDLSGAPMRFARAVTPTANARCDRYGVYGYSGATLSTILGDLDTEWFDLLYAANIKPDLAIGHALLENSIAGGVSYADCIKQLTQWLRRVQYRWPGVKVLLCTPHLSTSYNTGAKVTVYQQVRDYVLSLDDGYRILAARIDAYEDSDNPGQPLGTYTDGVHPNGRGALVVGRTIANTLKRLGGNFVHPFLRKSTSFALHGSAAASGTNISGTWATGMGDSGSGAVVGSSRVFTAEDPGVTVAVTCPAQGTQGDLGTWNYGSLAIAPTQLSPFAVVELVSGAQYLKNILLQPRINDGSGNTFQYYINAESASEEPQWQDGDVLTMLCPPLVATSGLITAVTNYIRPHIRLVGGTATIRLLSQGVGMVA